MTSQKQEKPTKGLKWFFNLGSDPAEYMRYRRILQELDRKGVEDLNRLKRSFQSQAFEVLKEYKRRKERHFKL